MRKQVLDVGGHGRGIPLPAQYTDWERIILDIDPVSSPDIILDARKICDELPLSQYAAVYCSHNLEHYYQHDVQKVLDGFYHVLKGDGFIHIRVPDLLALMKKVVTEGLDLDDTLYKAPIGSVSVRDVIYGYGPEIEKSGHDYYAHKTGFTPKSLAKVIKKSGFKQVFIANTSLEIRVIAFKEIASEYVLNNFNLKPKDIILSKLKNDMQSKKIDVGIL